VVQGLWCEAAEPYRLRDDRILLSFGPATALTDGRFEIDAEFAYV
jgi:hypothetical protein